ncbi:MAG: M14 family zinc carboxypeptidase, partial [Planctomycetota bacterium]
MTPSADPPPPSSVPIPPWWAGREEQIQAFLDNRVQRGEVRTLSTSPGGRPVRAVMYREAEPGLRGTANWGSALGAGQPDAFLRRAERQRPVLMILAGTHGQEMEGMVAALSLLSVMETGHDLRGQSQPALRESLDRLRLVVIPCANPDGRTRCPCDGWMGLPIAEMARWGQGTRLDGTPYG